MKDYTPDDDVERSTYSPDVPNIHRWMSYLIDGVKLIDIQPINRAKHLDFIANDEIKVRNGATTAVAALSTTLHGLNRRAGWWTDLQTGKPLIRNVGELLMLTASELSEAAQGYNEGKHDDKLPARLMFEVEIADTVIRIFDILGGLVGPNDAAEICAELLAVPWVPVIGKGFTSVYTDLFVPIIHLSEAMEGHRKGRKQQFDVEMVKALFTTVHVVQRHTLDLAGAVAQKVDYNFSREDHKIEVRRRDDGKKY